VGPGLALAAIGWQLATALAAFVVLAGLFAIRAMGGGDVKLLTVLALWIKPEWFLHLLMIMAIAGGILTLAMGLWHITRRQKERISVPYGIAIAVAGIWVVVSDYLPALQAGGKLG
jgi:prepilin peptidase CpaA